LSISILVWGATELISGFAVSFVMLLLSRLALGAVTATAGPTVASLTGDLFPARERSRIYGMILTGELLGAGLGVLIAGDLGAAISWRVGLAILALPSLALAWAIHRHFPEPARGGQSQLVEGAEEIPSRESVEANPDAHTVSSEAVPNGDAPDEEHPVLAMVDESDVQPDESAVRAAGSELTVWQAVRWVRRVPTNLSLIVASALGYFFLSGLRTFALIYARGRFGIGQGIATVVFLLIGLAAVAGVLASGKWTDRLIYRGLIDARLLVGGAAFLVAVLAFIPAMLTGSVLIGLPLFLVAAFTLSVPNPPVDAARLDVVPSFMWGRVESIRTPSVPSSRPSPLCSSASSRRPWLEEARAVSAVASTSGTPISQALEPRSRPGTTRPRSYGVYGRTRWRGNIFSTSISAFRSTVCGRLSGTG
jgi:predicted MFS family arabinose efflux permease